MENKKLFLQLLNKVKKHIEDNNIQFITETENPVISKFLVKNCEVKKLTYKECEKKYPTFLKAFTNKVADSLINRETETDEFLREQNFYIRVKK